MTNHLEVADLMAENARLRSALTQFVACCDTAPPTSLMIELGTACKVARAALDHGLPTAEDVRGILGDQTTPSEGVNVRWIIVAGPDEMCFVEERTSDARGKTSFGPMPNEDAVPFIQERKLQYVVDYTLDQTTPAPPPRPEPSEPFRKG